MSNDKMIRKILLALFLLASSTLQAENGHELWLRLPRGTQKHVTCNRISEKTDIALHELETSWTGAPVRLVVVRDSSTQHLGNEGFCVYHRNNCYEIRSQSDCGILYGTYALLRRSVTNKASLLRSGLITSEKPSYALRLLNHWDNQDGTVERGYAGHSIFWNNSGSGLTVTDADRHLWQEYSRANASLGINGAVLNNVNANSTILSSLYLHKVKAIADVLRPYNIRVYLSINFSSPMKLGGLSTADPLDKNVIAWWRSKVKEIYDLVPDFGGFLVKANSEGLPGPQDFGRTHADGANMLADALKPYDGIVMWRAFVYSPTDTDRAKQAYNEFLPLDGQFRDNVIVQVKNGPVDFQPREPFNPLFGAMKHTSVMPELQITMEYLGQSTHLVFLGPLWEECLQSDTYRPCKGSTVAACTDGSVFPGRLTAIAGVANIGLDADWCGHIFNQANWYAFGRLAWNDHLNSGEIAEEWLRLTFENPTPMNETPKQNKSKMAFERHFLPQMKHLMLESREVTVSYMMPDGLHHIFAGNHHYGPGPWYAPRGLRADWTPPYYHKADTLAIGFDRTHSGSNAVAQYAEPLCSMYNDVATCPENLLLWFHHLPWTYKMKNGFTLWDDLCLHYQHGVDSVRTYINLWKQMAPYVDQPRYQAIAQKLSRQLHDAIIWRDGCLLYFQQFSRRPFPKGVDRPEHTLQELEGM